MLPKPAMSSHLRSKQSNTQTLVCNYEKSAIQSLPPPSVPHLPVGIFWDIENIQVPFNRSAVQLVERIRQKCFERKYRESEFLVVCDTHKVNDELLNDLNAAQVTVIHVNCVAKNAADDKLRQQIQRFVDLNGYSSAVVMITDDVNFAPVLSDLRNRGRVEIMLIQRQAAPALRNSADFVINFTDLSENLEIRRKTHSKDRPIPLIKKCLHRMSTNCGGRKIAINPTNGTAFIHFKTMTDARRAQYRLHSQEVFGHSIDVTFMGRLIDDSCSDESGSSAAPPPPPPVATHSPQPLSRYSRPLQDLMSTDYRTRGNSVSSVQSHLNELMAYCSNHSSHSKRPASVESFQFGHQPSHKHILPAVHISISKLTSNVHHLLDTHAGCIPLYSFLDCFLADSNELLDTVTRPVVALEHLISCVPGVCVSVATATLVKNVMWIPNRNREPIEESEYAASVHSVGRKGGPTPGQMLAHFTKEVRELLKSQSHATIAFNKFVPTYHTHFVRQLCVGHYGHTKLIDLLDDLPHIVHVYGEGDGRMITLTHKEQTKRFATDLVKVLKAQNHSRLKLSDFPAAYHHVFGRPFDVSDYGVCLLDDILRDLYEGTVNISTYGSNDRLIELPKRDRSDEHMRRTVAFSREVVELLRYSREVVNFQMTFSLFIPCYHRYFNRQCRVIDYGFNKLIELLEELSPHVIEIIANSEDELCGEKQIRLSRDTRVYALISRFETILRHQSTRSLRIDDFEQIYRQKYNSEIDYFEFGSVDLIDFVDKMSANKFRIVTTQSNGTQITLMDKNHIRLVAKRAVRLLMEEFSGELNCNQLESRYLSEFGDYLSRHIFTADDYRDVFVVVDDQRSVRLSDLFLLARRCIQCIQSARKRRFTVEELDREFMKQFGEPLPQPTFFKCCNFSELFAKFFDFFHVVRKGKSDKTLTIGLDMNFAKRPLVVKPPAYKILPRPVVTPPSNRAIGAVGGDTTDDLLDSDVPDNLNLPLPDLVPGGHTGCDGERRDLINLLDDSSSSAPTSVTNDRKSSMDLIELRVESVIDWPVYEANNSEQRKAPSEPSDDPSTAINQSVQSTVDNTATETDDNTIDSRIHSQLNDFVAKELGRKRKPRLIALMT